MIDRSCELDGVFMYLLLFCWTDSVLGVQKLKGANLGPERQCCNNKRDLFHNSFPFAGFNGLLF